MASDLCTLSVQIIGQITVHLLFGPVSHIPHSFPRNTQAWQAPVRPKASLVRRQPRTYTPTCTCLWKMSTGPTIHHRPSSSGPRRPGGTRPLNPSDRNPPRLAPRRTQRDHLTPPRRRPRRLPLARTLPPRAPRSTPVRLLGDLLATEFMANLQKTVDTMPRAACARSSKDSVFTKTVREQIKEVGKTAGRIYDHMEWVDKAHTNSVATLNLLQTVQQWSTAIHEELSGVSRQLTNLSDMLKQVLDCMRTFSEAPPAPTYQAPPPYGYPRMLGNAPGAPYYAHPPAPVNPHDPRTRAAPIPPVVSQTVTPAPSVPVPVSQAAPVAPAPVSPTPPMSGTPVATQGDPKPTASEGAAATSTGADTGAAPKRREEYPTEQILVIKMTSPDHFLTEFLSHVQKPLLAAGFARRTLNHLVKS
jgi:hypothetical protein